MLIIIFTGINQLMCRISSHDYLLRFVAVSLVYLVYDEIDASYGTGNIMGKMRGCGCDNE